ncbi:MAG: hypothetical protein M3008_11565 [Chloroflexota bacterium]|nr:hypothetical protein [Chloroflexota bacterium]
MTGPLFNPVTGELRPEFIGTRLTVVGVFHDAPPATDGPKMALTPRDTAEFLRRDPGLFQPEMLVQPTIEIWYAEIYPPDSDLCVLVHWSPQGGKRLGIPEMPANAIRGVDLDKAKIALDLFLFDPTNRRPAHRPGGSGVTPEEFRKRFIAAWNGYVAENGGPPMNTDLIPLMFMGKSTFYELKRKDPGIVEELKSGGLIRTYSDTETACNQEKD